MLEGAEDGTSVKKMIGMNVFYVVTGLLCAAIIGHSMGCIFSCCDYDQKSTDDINQMTDFEKGEEDQKMENHESNQRLVKFFVMVAIAVATPLVANSIKFEESKFIMIIFFGYFCNQVWGEEGKPEKELAFFWIFCQPFVFATVGAAVQFSSVKPNSLGKGILVILLGLTFRWLGTCVAMAESKYNCYERCFMGFAWIPKATVQAAIGGIVLSKAQDFPLHMEANGLKNRWVEWGKDFLSMAVVAVIITAPLGAVLTNTLGVRWLSDDSAARPQTAEMSTSLSLSFASRQRPNLGL